MDGCCGREAEMESQLHICISVHDNMRVSAKPRPSITAGVMLPLRLCAMTAVIVTSTTLGCAGPRAILNFAMPTTATVGTPFTVTVNVTVNGQPDRIFDSFIVFTSSDPAAVLPGEYVFSPADAGSHTWTNGFTLNTPGRQTVSGIVYDARGINGSATVIVSP